MVHSVAVDHAVVIVDKCLHGLGEFIAQDDIYAQSFLEDQDHVNGLPIPCVVGSLQLDGNGQFSTIDLMIIFRDNARQCDM